MRVVDRCSSISWLTGNSLPNKVNTLKPMVSLEDFSMVYRFNQSAHLHQRLGIIDGRTNRSAVGCQGLHGRRSTGLGRRLPLVSSGFPLVQKLRVHCAGGQPGAPPRFMTWLQDVVQVLCVRDQV